MADVPYTLSPTEDLSANGFAAQVPEAPVPEAQVQVPEAQVPQVPETEVPHVTLASHGDGPVYDLFDHVNNAVIKIPESDLELAIKSGQYTMPKGQQIPVITPDGKPGTVPSDTILEALEQGLKIDKLADRTERELQAKYGNSDFEAAAQGFARGTSLGISDQLQTKLGITSPERLREVKDRNPEAALTGEIASFLVPSGLGGKAVKVGINAIERVGVMAERAAFKELEKVAVKLGANSKYAQAVIAKIPSKGVGSAVEGAFYGAGQLLSEDALGKADFNAENLAAYAGTGALLGGGFGMGLAGVAEVARPVAKYAGEQLGKVTKYAGDKERAALELLGYTPAQITKLKDRRGQMVSDLPEFLRSEVKLARGDTPEGLLNKVAHVNEEAGNKIGSILEDVEQLGQQFKDLTPDKHAVFKRIADKLDEQFVSKYIDVPGYGSQLAPVQNLVQDFRKLSATTFDVSVKELHEMRKKIDGLIRYEKVPGQFSLKEEAGYAARTMLKEEIDILAQKASAIKGGESMAEQLAHYNKSYSYTEEILDKLAKKVDKEHRLVSFSDLALGGIGVGIGHGPLGAGAVAGYKFLKSDLRRKMTILSDIEKAQQKVASAVKSATKGFVESSKVIPKMSALNLSDSFMSNDLSESKPRKAKSESEAYGNVVRNLQNYSTNPEALMARSNKITSALYDAAPETSAAVDVVAVNGAAFLASKVPKRLQDPTAFSELSKAAIPSKLEISKFMRYVKGVEKPMDVLKELEAGHVNREGLEAIKHVYPSVFQNIQDSVLDHIQKSKTKLPYNKKIQLGILFDVPTDQSMKPENITALQAPFQAQQAAQGAQGISDGSEPGKRALTGAEALESTEDV